MSIFTTINEAQDRAESAAYEVRQIAKALSTLGMSDAAFAIHEAVDVMLSGYKIIYAKASGDLDEDLKRSKGLAGSMLRLTMDMAESGALDVLGRHAAKKEVRK